MNTPPPLPSFHPSQPPVNRSSTWIWAYAVGSSFFIFVLLARPAHPPSESLGDTKVRTAEIERQATLTRVQGLQVQLNVLRQSLAMTEAEKAVHQTKVKDYAMDHKLAILAIGGTVAGTAVALDQGNQFTADQKTAAGWTAAAAATYALFNHEEILEVTDRMAKAAAMISDYDGRIGQSQREIAALELQLAQSKKSLR